MRRRDYLSLSLLGVWGLPACKNESSKEGLGPQSHATQKEQTPSIVSLSPGLTETLLALGQASSITGISDYCAWPPEQGKEPPRVGSAITPNYERIAAAQPNLILATQVAGEQLRPLERLARTVSLPWLSVAELTTSVKELGPLIHREAEAERLSEELLQGLSQVPQTDAPRVLLALDYGDSGSNDTWFIRRNSIHGAVLHAAGAQNAVDRDVEGSPRLSPEQLLSLDPEIILVVRPHQEDPEAEARSIRHFQKWTPLQAVREKRIGVISSPNALTVGPSVLTLAAPLSAKIKELLAPEKKPTR